MKKEIQFLRQLRKTLAKHFNLAELQGLAFDLGLNWDELAGDTLSLKSQSLIGFMRRNGRMATLLQLLQEERPDLDWPHLPAHSSTPPTIHQTDAAPDAARKAVWNALYQTLWTKKTFLKPFKQQQPTIDKFSIRLWSDYFNKLIDERPLEPEKILQEIRHYFFTCSEAEFYRYLEFILHYWNDLRHYKPELINRAVNKALKQAGAGREYVPQYGYNRFVSGAIVQVHPNYPQEIDESSLPTAVAELIHERAKKRFPDDFSTRKFQIDKEEKAWHELQTYQAPDIPQDILVIIFKRAEAHFPDDFSTRKYQVEKEVNAWRYLQTYQPADIPQDDLAVILEKAVQTYPDDFSTQKYVIEKEVKAWRSLIN